MLPFAVLLVFLGLSSWLPVAPAWAYSVRTVAVLAALLIYSRRAVSLRPSRALLSVLLGAAVFAIWIAPDLLWPAYRQHWLFRNPVTMTAPGAVLLPQRSNLLLLLFRVGGSVLLVPIVEELFWRAWLMRRFIRADFQTVPLGAYAARSFWLTALLFASEHGSYWAVGLAAGIAYNWWMVRTRSLGDCILAHAVTNGCLAVYVLAAGKWEYWL